MKIGSAFSGIGAWEKAFIYLGIKHELKWFFENDKFAPKSYCAIHNIDESLNKGDITKADVSELGDIDVLVYSPPCQAFSVAGKGLGIKDPRGKLFYDTLPIIKAKKPKYALMENVKGLTNKGHKDLFKDMLNELNLAGYNNYWTILNAKDYGIPQNRERVFVISIRKDIDVKDFEFPAPYDNGLKLRDFLEDEVEDKYYIDKPYELLANSNDKSVCKQIAKVDLNGHDYLKRVYDKDYCCPTLPTGTGGNHQPKILEDFYKNRPVREYEDYAPSLRAQRQGLKVVKGCSTRTRSYMGQSKRLEIRKDDVVNSITTVQKDSMITDYSIVRKLTPKEYIRLMGFEDEDYYKMKEIKMSDTQIYRQAGNSIVVNVPEAIYRVLFKDYIAENKLKE